MSRNLDWQRDRQDWPHQDSSRFYTVDGIRWHVQTIGAGPCLLLVHGTGASTHSWAELATLLADRFRVVMMDLPGHGFSGVATAQNSSLSGMANGIAALLAELKLDPLLAVGHSAGAAILVQMCMQGSLRPSAVASFNGAFIPFDGLPGKLFVHAARLFATNDLVPRFFSRRATDDRAVMRLIDQTGSTIPKASAKCYQKLMRSPSHVAAALKMMANWNLRPLFDQIHQLDVPLHLVSCENDRTIPLAQARRLQSRLPAASLHTLDGLGHLGHEEAPDRHHALLLSIAETLRIAE